MKLRHLAASVAMATVLPYAGQALALAPNATIDAKVFMSGSSGQQKTLAKLLASNCQAGTLDTYLDHPTTGSDGTAWRNYSCTLNTAAPVPASLQGKNIEYYDRAKGGSVYGVVPLARSWNVEFLQNNTSNCAETATGSHTWACTFESNRSSAIDTSLNDCPHNANDYSASDASTICRVPNVGVSDVEPAMFVGPNLPSGWTALSPSELAGINANSEYGIIFAVSVTNDVASALIAAGDTDGHGHPNLTHAQVAGIFSGTLTNWGDVDPSLNLANIGAGIGNMGVCRRTPGSGTEASQQAHFLGQPCLNGSIGGQHFFVTDASSQPPVYVVNEGEGSGNVIDCQNFATTGAQYFNGVPAGAIGINAIEKQPGANDNWQYIAVDGIFPNQQNAVSGAYSDVYFNSIQWRNSLTGMPLDAAKLVRDESGKPTVMQAAGLAGVVALPTTNNWATDTTGLVTHAYSGGNSCAFPVQAPPKG